MPPWELPVGTTALVSPERATSTVNGDGTAIEETTPDTSRQILPPVPELELSTQQIAKVSHRRPSANPPKLEKPKQPKLPKPTIPPGVEPPHRGIPKLVWRYYCKPLGIRSKQHREYYRVPKPNGKEQLQRVREIAEYKLWYGLAWHITYLHALRSLPDNNIVIGFYNPQGFSGKTSNALSVTSTATWVRPDLPLVTLPMAPSVSKGGLGALSGLYTEADSQWRINDFFAHLGEITSPKTLFGRTPANLAGLHVIGEAKKLGANSRTMTPDQLFKLIDYLRPLAFGGMGLDMNNEVVDSDGFVYGVMDRVDVVVLPAMAGSQTSRDNLRQAIMDLLGAPLQYQGYDPAHPVTIRQKLEKAIVVVNNVPEGQEIDFTRYLQLNARRYEGQTFTTPHEPSLQVVSDEEQATYHHRRISLEKLLADLKITAACYESGARLRELGGMVAYLQNNTTPDLELASERLGTDLGWLAHPKPYQRGF